uniref:UV-B-induced protein, chloroplastic n=1 Tax=Noccaea caerulescens TaxID=107243 RepID=A0A1J3FSY1_NOCCA
MQAICSSHGRLCFKHCHSLPDSFSNFLSPSSSPSLLPQRCHSFCNPKLGSSSSENGRGRGVMTVRASGKEDSHESFAPIAPVELESPVGQLLEQILRTHPHLLHITVDQQLEKLASENESLKSESSLSQDVLSKRISEVRDKEKRKTLAEIIYCLVVQRFVEKEISMIPQIKSTSDPVGRVDLWPNQEEKLEVIHSSEAFEMIQSHLSSVLGDRTAVGPLSSIVQISKIKLGKLYAASVMYGYFLRRIDQRYQLERTMNTLPKRPEKTRERFEEPSPPYPLWDPDSLIRIQPEEYDPDEYAMERNQDESSSYGLRSYVTYLDSDTLQRYATIRSKEAMSLIEKQTQALFGRPDIRILEDGKLDTSNDEVLSLSFSGLAMLVLEAVTFGSFLWDAESYVESKYHFLKA